MCILMHYFVKSKVSSSLRLLRRLVESSGTWSYDSLTAFQNYSANYYLTGSKTAEPYTKRRECFEEEKFIKL